MSGPLIDLKNAKRIWVGATEAQKLWVGQTGWIKPAAPPSAPPSRLYLDAAPVSNSDFILSDALPQSITIRSAAGSRRHVTWLVNIVPGCQIEFSYRGSGSIWARTTNDDAGAEIIHAFFNDRPVGSDPVFVSQTVSTTASRFSILCGSSAPAGEFFIESFRIYVP